MYKDFDNMKKRDYIDEERQQQNQLFYFALTNVVLRKYM